jgi:hypothetical protein
MADSGPSATAPVPAPENTQYSTLEVDHNRLLENDGKAAPIVGPDPKDEKIISYNDVGKQAVVIDVYESQHGRVTANRLLLFPRTFHHQHLLKHQQLLEYNTETQAWQPCNGLISMAHCTRDSITKTTTIRFGNLVGITALLPMLPGMLMPSAMLSSLVHLSQQRPDIPMPATTTHWCVLPNPFSAGI